MSRKPLPVDELLSYAARSGDSVRVQLHLRDSELRPGNATMRLRAGRRTHEVPAQLEGTGSGVAITFTATGQLGNRAWQLILRMSDGDSPIPLAARLLAAADQPVALLPGPTPTTEMSPPAPRASGSAARRLARRLPEPVKRPLRRGRSMLAARTRS